ncbi:AAA family ATPase [Anaerostipes hadrus]|uniref:AAA family ATPase n=1 Tax=Anaerostipes hadrus TaxID=649756 RepID=UPI001570FC2C|nr:AAA family ATPase [Anaerostipes hadrus]
MKEYFISEIDIEKLYHLSDIKIKLDSNKRQHLLLTGKNGSGKTSLLLEIEKFLRAINDEKLSQVFDQYPTWINEAKKKVLSASSDSEKYAADKDLKQCLGFLKKYSDGVQINLNQYEGLEMMYHNGKFITAYFPSERKAQFMRPNGVENITLENTYGIDESAGDILLKYMVHLKTQQAYARNEGDQTTANQIQKWFDRFDSALQILLDEESIHIEYDYKKYNFKIRQNGREPFSFNELSDGYSSVIYIVSDLILRMDKNWLLEDKISEYDYQGIVLIDELETHLHIELQKKIFPFLTKFFPRIQFIVTTHSPYILNSISNAKAYDLERQVELDNLSGFSSDDLAEGYFEADAYSDELKNSLNRYEELCLRNDLTEDERAERAEIRIKFKNISTELSGVAKERFEDIERRRKAND